MKNKIVGVPFWNLTLPISAISIAGVLYQGGFIFLSYVWIVLAIISIKNK